MVFEGTLNRHTISGQVLRINNTGIPGVTVKLIYSETVSVITDENGFYSFANLPAGQNYELEILPKDDLLFVPVAPVFNDLSANVTLNISARLQPEVMTLEHSDDAIVLDSVSFLTQPLSIFQPLNLSDDGLARMIVFVKNIGFVFSTSHVVVTAQDSENQVHTLPVEFQGNVANQSELKQINVKLSPELGHGECIQLRVSVDGLQSNPARVCFAPLQ
jgi:hypothetical protein